MVLSVGVIALYLLLSTQKRSLVPNRGAADFRDALRVRRQNGIGHRPAKAGMKFFPFVFSLFMFVLVANMFGMIPFFFTFTSHIIITFALALLVFVVVIVYGIYKNGLKFFKLFVPSGCPRLRVAHRGADRGGFVPLAPDLAQRSSVRQHPCRSHHPQGVRGLHRYAGWPGLPRLARRAAAAGHDGGRSRRSNSSWRPCRPTSLQC